MKIKIIASNPEPGDSDITYLIGKVFNAEPSEMFEGVFILANDKELFINNTEFEILEV